VEAKLTPAGILHGYRRGGKTAIEFCGSLVAAAYKLVNDIRSCSLEQPGLVILLTQGLRYLDKARQFLSVALY
jgi:hypothetical protein